MVKPHFPHDAADPLLTTREAAVQLGVSLRSVQLWVESGTLPAGRTPGGHRRIRESAVAALAKRSGIPPPKNANKEVADLKEALRGLLVLARNLGVGDTDPALRAAEVLGEAA